MTMSLASLGGAYRPNFNIDDPSDSLNQQRMGGIIQYRMTPEQAELAKQQSSQQFINNAAANTDMLARPQTKPAYFADPVGGGGSTSPNSNSTLSALMALLTGGQFGGSSAKNVQSGDTSIQENTGDTLGSITSFINNLLQTAMSGKTAADRNATDLGTTLMGHNANAALANQASQERGNRQTWVGNAFASLKPGYKPASVPGASTVDTSLFAQGVPTQQIFGGGLGGADPTGVLGIEDQTKPPPPPPPPPLRFKGTNNLMSGTRRSMLDMLPGMA